MSLVETIAGPYNGAYNSQTVGLTEGGMQVRFRPEKQLVNKSHLYGDTILDSIYTGMNAMLTFRCIEFAKAIAYGMAWPFGAQNSGNVPVQGYLGKVGMMDVGSNLTKAMILTAVAGTTAAAAPASLTASKSILAENADIDYMLAPVQRTVPIALRLYPYTTTNPSGFPSGTYEVFYTQT